MKTKEYYWGGNTYVCRIVQANDGEELIIAPTALLDIIQPGSFGDENEGFANKEAEYIYDEIFFLHGCGNSCFTRGAVYRRAEEG